MEAAIIWIALIIIFAVVEIITVGLTSIWFAGGAVVALLVDAAGLGPVWQFAAFVVVSVILLVFTRPWALKYMKPRLVKTNYAIKCIYSVETSLETPYQDNLHSLLNSEDFRDYVGNDLWRRLDYIRRKGNSVAHNNRRQGFDEAMLCLENLHIFMDFISCCYVRGYEQREFDRNAILNRRENAKKSNSEQRSHIR